MSPTRRIDALNMLVLDATPRLVLKTISDSCRMAKGELVMALNDDEVQFIEHLREPVLSKSDRASLRRAAPHLIAEFVDTLHSRIYPPKRHSPYSLSALKERPMDRQPHCGIEAPPLHDQMVMDRIALLAETICESEFRHLTERHIALNGMFNLRVNVFQVAFFVAALETAFVRALPPPAEPYALMNGCAICFARNLRLLAVFIRVHLRQIETPPQRASSLEA
jgi:hypothetical protein